MSEGKISPRNTLTFKVLMLNLFFLYEKKKGLSVTDNHLQHSPLPLSYLLPFSVQPKQADKAADLQQEINKNSQASKE